MGGELYFVGGSKNQFSFMSVRIITAISVKKAPLIHVRKLPIRENQSKGGFLN